MCNFLNEKDVSSFRMVCFYSETIKVLIIINRMFEATVFIGTYIWRNTQLSIITYYWCKQITTLIPVTLPRTSFEIKT